MKFQYLTKKQLRERGIEKEIKKNESLVFDFMPRILGHQFMANPILSRQLFRERPVDGTFSLEQDGYTQLGLKYLKQKQITPALECYKFVLKSQTGFGDFVSSLNGAILLSPKEIQRMNLGGPLEDKLVKEFSNKKIKVTMKDYTHWVDKLRAAYKLCNILDTTDFSNFPNLCVEIEVFLGMWGYAEDHARQTKDKNLIHRAKLFMPREILDVKWLSKYAEDNWPESSYDRM